MIKSFVMFLLFVDFWLGINFGKLANELSNYEFVNHEAELCETIVVV